MCKSYLIIMIVWKLRPISFPAQVNFISYNIPESMYRLDMTCIYVHDIVCKNAIIMHHIRMDKKIKFTYSLL